MLFLQVAKTKEKQVIMEKKFDCKIHLCKISENIGNLVDIILIVILIKATLLLKVDCQAQ